MSNKSRKKSVTSKKDKEDYEHCEFHLGIILTITLMMAGMVFYSLDVIGIFSILFILIYIILFLTIMLSGLFAVRLKNNKLAKINFFCSIIIFIVFSIYAIMFLLLKTGVRIDFTIPSSNFTQST
jgi:Mn2+/Fe2+ NRAMP family transporter